MSWHTLDARAAQREKVQAMSNPARTRRIVPVSARSSTAARRVSAATLRAQGKRERMVPEQAARDHPFDHGSFRLELEDLPQLESAE